jgi:membrane protein implicated in regulation of membrane protease activity
MEFTAATVWWILAGLLVAIELATGTFYLLMLATGAAAAALAAHLGLGQTPQLLAAAAVASAGVVIWHRQRGKRHPTLPASINPDVNLDIGQSVHVDAWSAGVTQVQYRGAQWQARFIGVGTASSGTHLIQGIEGSCLLLDSRLST